MTRGAGPGPAESLEQDPDFWSDFTLSSKYVLCKWCAGDGKERAASAHLWELLRSAIALARIAADLPHPGKYSEVTSMALGHLLTGKSFEFTAELEHFL